MYSLCEHPRHRPWLVGALLFACTCVVPGAAKSEDTQAATEQESARADNALARHAKAALIPIGPIPGPTGDPTLPKNPLEDTAAVRQHGRELYTMMNCVGCHGGHAGGGIGPSLRDESWIYGGDDAHVYASIVLGRAHGMPAWGTLLPEDEIWSLVAYIASLRTADEPSPPH